MLGIDQQRDALARGQAPLGVLRLDGLLAATLLDLFLVHAEARDQFGDGVLVALEARRGSLYLGGDLGGRSGVLVLSHDGRSCTRGQTDNDKAAERLGAMRDKDFTAETLSTHAK